jgi:hypothetical protein
LDNGDTILHNSWSQTIQQPIFFFFFYYGEKKEGKKNVATCSVVGNRHQPHPKNEACSHIKNLQVYQLKIELAPVTITLQLTNLFEQKQK